VTKIQVNRHSLNLDTDPRTDYPLLGKSEQSSAIYFYFLILSR